MAGTTPRGYQYPDGTDPANLGDDIIRANTARLDAELTAGLPYADVIVTALTAGAGSIDYSAAGFTAPPVVTATHSSGGLPNYAVALSVGNITSTQCSVFARSVQDGPNNAKPYDGNLTLQVVAVPATATGGAS